MTEPTDNDDEEYECTKCGHPVDKPGVTYSPDGDPYHAGCNPWRMCTQCGEMSDNYTVHRGQYYCEDCPTPRPEY
jgi:hypothetical protein